MPEKQSAAATPQSKKGTVKQLLSGDAIVLRGSPINGPPKETTVYLTNVSAPRVGKRPTENQDEVLDEPYAWESREFLRQKLIGKEVTFIRDFVSTSGREHGRVFLGDENVTESAVSEGWLEVRQGIKGTDEYTQKLMGLQESAKTAKKGKWAPESEAKAHIRQIQWNVEADKVRMLVDSLKQKPQKAVIEQIRDGSTVRAFLLPQFQYITVIMSGVKAPILRLGAEGRISEAEAYGEEAKFFTECRLLQRDIEIVLEGVSNQNFVGSILHPKGNIAEMLLREGFGKCVDWSIGLASCGTELLRNAEREAKEQRIRLWKSYQPSSVVSDKKSFSGRVVEIGMGDSMSIQKDGGETIKIWLSSIRSPKLDEGASKESVGRQFRPLYDIPFMFEAREFLRKRLIGKKVNVTVDYVQPKSDNFPEKTACTVMIGQQNVAEALLQKGLARVVRYRQDDDNRSAHYDLLLAAEAKAEKSKKGVHQDKRDRPSVVRVQELNDATRSKQFLPYLTRAGRTEGIVEFVSSGSRLRLFVPKETCLMQFLPAGISCPRSGRPGPGGQMIDGDPFGDEAARFTKSKCLQMEVSLEVESMDKGGSFIGYLFIHTEDGSCNLSELLVSEGLASVHFSAERSKYHAQLCNAEKKAKEQRLNIWHNWTSEQESEATEESAEEKQQERIVAYKQIVVTNVDDNLKFAAQSFDDGPKLEQLMRDFRSEFESKAPMIGSYQPRRGDLCAAKFTDGLWYRAKVEAVRGNEVGILYVDFGNRQSTDKSKLAQLPSIYQTQSVGAHEYSLALLQLPNDSDYRPYCIQEFQQLVYSASRVLLNREYRGDFVSLVAEDSEGEKTDIGKSLIEKGLALVENRKDRRLQQMLGEYQEAQQKAKRDRLNIWEYGDFTGEEI